jgi:shikimate dehydrogenase
VNALRFAVIGTPIAHSLSPRMHAAAYRALGLPHVYEKIETRPDQLVERVAALRAGTFAGLNVTVPHKGRVLAFVDEIDASAEAVGAANTLVRTEAARVRAHNTDVPALVAELTRLAGDSDAARLAGRTAIVLGSGGAARAAIAAVRALGFGRVVVRARGLDAGARPEVGVSLARAAHGAEILVRGLAAGDDEARAAVVVQATSCGMPGGPPGDVVANAIAWTELPGDAVALDVVYGVRTPFLAAAAARGLACEDGLGMLATQGALAFAMWLGAVPPRTAMLEALRGG